jgi:indolepyruvate ferredoxin oxidoreductase, beta subunit
MSGAIHPRSILIAALGGEGGGVLAEWLVACATQAGLASQATSVPGVAQRTGATSYYIEFMPQPLPPGSQPVFALMPVPGRVDVLLASELLEAARMVERGFVDREHTLLIAASHRVYTTLEKMQMGDGRQADDRLHAAAQAAAKRYISLDLRAIALTHGTAISAVMFGALAGSGALPWPRALCEQIIRDSGLGVAASLAGFNEAHKTVAEFKSAPAATAASPALDEVIALGAERLSDYQDLRYAQQYRERIAALRAVANPQALPALEEAARQLALWMSYEDVIRVADLKTRGERLERLRAEVQAGSDDIVQIHEHLKPSLEEIAAIAPLRIGSWLMGKLAHDTPVGTRGRGMTLATTSVSGFALLRLLACLKRWRRASLRFHQEQQAIEAWLAALTHALPLHAAYAQALAELPRLRKGYSDTMQRGRANYERIVQTLVRPWLSAPPDDAAAQALRNAITAALADPQAKALEQALGSARDAVAAQPISFRPREVQRAPTP